MLLYDFSESTILDSYRRILKQHRIGFMIHLFNTEGIAHLASRAGHSLVSVSVNPTIFTHEILIGYAEYTARLYSSTPIDITLTTQHVNPYKHRCHNSKGILYERPVEKFLPISKQPLPLGKLRILIFKGVKI